MTPTYSPLKESIIVKGKEYYYTESYITTNIPRKFGAYLKQNGQIKDYKIVKGEPVGGTAWYHLYILPK